MSSAGRISISSCFQHGLQDSYLKPHVKSGLFPLTQESRNLEIRRDIVFSRPRHFTYFLGVLYNVFANCALSSRDIIALKKWHGQLYVRGCFAGGGVALFERGACSKVHDF